MGMVLTNYDLGLIVNTNGSRRIRKPLFVSKTITETTRRRQAVEGVEKERLPVRGSSKTLANLVTWWNRLLWVFWAFLAMCLICV